MPPAPPKPLAPGSRPTAVPRISTKDHAGSIGASLEAAGKRGGRVIVSVESGFYDETVTVPTAVSLVGNSADDAPVVKRVVLGGHAAEVDAFVVTDGIKIARGTKNCKVSNCTVSNVADSGIESEGAVVRVEGCTIGDCEDGIYNKTGQISIVGCTIQNCDCDGIFSNTKIQLVSDVTFSDVGRHEINSKAGVEKTVVTKKQPPRVDETVAPKTEEVAVDSPPKIPETAAMGWVETPRGPAEWVAVSESHS